MQAHGAQTDYKEQRRGTRASGKHEQSREKRHARDRRVNVRERGKATMRWESSRKRGDFDTQQRVRSFSIST